MKKPAKTAPPAIDPVTRARNVLKRLGQVPAMLDVPTELATAHNDQENATRRTDALVILGRARGMTWDAIGGLLKVSKQGAKARHDAAVKRFVG